MSRICYVEKSTLSFLTIETAHIDCLTTKPTVRRAPFALTVGTTGGTQQLVGGESLTMRGLTVTETGDDVGAGFRGRGQETEANRPTDGGTTTGDTIGKTPRDKVLEDVVNTTAPFILPLRSRRPAAIARNVRRLVVQAAVETSVLQNSRKSSNSRMLGTLAVDSVES